MRGARTILSVVLVSIFSVACEKCRPDLVGPGVARLTVRNVGAIADLVNKDANCGFESPLVKESFDTNGSVGGPGTATWTVSECEIDLSRTPLTSTDCNGNSTAISGKVTVSAKRKISGTLTGNAEQPVIPVSPDAVTVEITRAVVERFHVEASNSDAMLTQISGAISASVKPRLGASESTGVCMVPTRNALINDVRYENAVVHVKTADREFDVEVPTSDFWAVNGRVGNEENSMAGTINVWGDPIPVPGDADGLDPEYDREGFDESYACTEDLRNPVSFECGDVAPILAQGAARLTIRNLGAIAKITERDTGCGFSSQRVLQSAVLSGPVGSQGNATFRVDDCTIEIPANTVLSTDCNGATTAIGGRFTISATKKLTGRLSGDLEQPVVPVSDTPAEIEIRSARFENFRVDAGGTALTMVAGSIGGHIVPRLAMDDALGACAAETSIARMTNVAYGEGSRVKLSAPQGTFDTVIDGSNLTAVNGTMGSDTNVLRGSISVGGESFNLPTNPADDGLDPEYDQAAFDSAWMCGTVNRQAPFECSVLRPLAQGAAQLSVLTLGTLADLIERDTTCGFSSARVLDSVQITGTLGDPGGTATFAISEPCRLSFSMPVDAKTDCNGKTTRLQGTAAVRGTKVLSGYVSGDRLQPIVPTTRDPAVIALDVTFTSFRISSSADDNALGVSSGRLQGTIRPRIAVDVATGACSIATPVAELSNISWQDGVLNVQSQGKSFDVRVASSMLHAVNGSRDGVTNRLTGTISVDGEAVMLDGPLDPAFSQSTFDSSYACTPGLKLANADAECNMKKPLAEGTARLLISALGTVTGVVNDDDDCGFQSNLTDPSLVVGEPGQMGSMEWEIQNCALSRTGNNATQAYATDCLNRRSYYSGVATVTAKRHVDGLREEIRLLFLTFDSIVPKTREAVTVTESSISFNNFASYELDPGQTSPARGITIKSGTMGAVVTPILGERADEVGTFDVPTKVARLSNVSVSNANVTIVYLGKTFNVRVDNASLSAFNGSYASTGEKNLISGSITVGGETFSMEPQALDPEFDQASFDARYACTDNLRATVPAAP